MKIRNVIGLAGLALAATANAQTTYTGYAGGSPTVGGLPIPDASTTGVAITISSTLGSAITDMVLTLQFGTGTTAGNREHSWIGDLIVTLAYTPGSGPAIGAQTILERVGRTGGQGGASGFGRSDDANGTYNFANVGTTLITNALLNIQTQAAVAFNVPSNLFTPNAVQSDGYTAHIGVNAIANAFAPFIGADGTGTWTVFITDRGAGDTGDILSASVTLIPTPGAAALLGLGGLAAARRRRA